MFRRVVARAVTQVVYRPQPVGFEPPPTSLSSSSAFFIPQRWRKGRKILRKGENIGHINSEIEGATDEGTLSHLPFFGEKPPLAASANDIVKGQWNPGAKRTGVIGFKVGMMNVWDARGVKTLLTVIKVDNCQVIQVRKEWTPQGEKYINLQVGSGTRNIRRMPKAALCHFRKAGVEPKKKMGEFRVTEDGILPVGTQITARHFVPGQYVDITGITKGKGFQGVMKRWGFAGQPASHGNSLTHRHLGSTGQCQDPGKVFKGKKMPGRMGNKRRCHLNNQIYKIDVARNLVFVRGSVPGNNGGWLRMEDGRRKEWNKNNPPPFPTYNHDPSEEPVDELVMDVSHLTNPFKLGCA